MTKIVFNACYGGFSLSHEAILRYAEIKGIRLWIEERDGVEKFFGPIYYLLAPDEREGKKYNEINFYDRDIDRADPALVQVVEELGEKANGRAASLAIAEVAAGAKYRIDEYGGNEAVMTPDDYEWETA